MRASSEARVISAITVGKGRRGTQSARAAKLDPAGQPFFKSQIGLLAAISRIRPGQPDLVGHGGTRTRRHSHHDTARLSISVTRNATGI
jgi:hypothetical protein